MLSNRNSHLLLVKIQNNIDTLEVSSADFHETKHALNIQSSNYISRYLAKGVENLCTHKSSQGCL